MKALIILLLAFSITSCVEKKEDPMKECMKTKSHMQCVKELSKE